MLVSFLPSNIHSNPRISPNSQITGTCSVKYCRFEFYLRMFPFLYVVFCFSPVKQPMGHSKWRIEMFVKYCMSNDSEIVKGLEQVLNSGACVRDAGAGQAVHH